jgi:hypothetical protein
MKIESGPINVLQLDQDRDTWDLKGSHPHNDELFGAADILSRLLSGDSRYAITHMYLEFANGVFTAPSFTRADGRSYYAGLGGSSDFLRIALSASPRLSASSASYVTNQLTFFAQANDGTGVNALSFSGISRLVGVALVTSPTGIYADDVVYSRLYFTTPNQVPKVSGQQLGVEYPVRFL